MSQDTPEATPSPAEEDLLDEATLRAAWEAQRPDADAFLAGVRERVERREVQGEQRLRAIRSLPGWSQAAAVLVLPKAALGKVAPAAGSKLGLQGLGTSLALVPALSLVALVGLFGWLVGLLRREVGDAPEPRGLERALVRWARSPRTLDLTGKEAWIVLGWPLLMPVILVLLYLLGDLFFLGLLGLGMTAGALSVRDLARVGALTRAEAARSYAATVMQTGWYLFLIDLGESGGPTGRFVLLGLMALGALSISLVGDHEPRERILRLLRPERTLRVPDRLTVAILRAGGVSILLVAGLVALLWGAESVHRYGLAGRPNAASLATSLLGRIAGADEPASNELWTSLAALDPTHRQRVDAAALADDLEPLELRALGIGAGEPENGWDELATRLTDPRLEGRSLGFEHRDALALARTVPLDAAQRALLRSRNLATLERGKYASTTDALLAVLLERELAGEGPSDPALVEAVERLLWERWLGSAHRSGWGPGPLRGGFDRFALDELDAGGFEWMPRRRLFAHEREATLEGLLALRGLDRPAWLDLEAVRRSAQVGSGPGPAERLMGSLLSGVRPELVDQALALVLARDFPEGPSSLGRVLVQHRIEVAILLAIGLGLFAVLRIPRERRGA